MKYKMKEPFRVGRETVITPKVFAKKILDAFDNNYQIMNFFLDSETNHLMFHKTIEGVVTYYEMEKSVSGEDWVLKLRFDIGTHNKSIIPLLKIATSLVYKQLGLTDETVCPMSFTPKYVETGHGWQQFDQ